MSKRGTATQRKDEQDAARTNLIGLPSMQPIEIDEASQIMVEGLMITKGQLDEAQKRFEGKVKTVFTFLEKVHGLPAGALGTTHQLQGFTIIPQSQAKDEGEG